MTRATIGPHDTGFGEFSAAHDALGLADIHRGALPFLPPRPGLMLDVGAGSGRNAAWFAARAWDVVAVEPASARRADAARRHPSPAIRWVDDSLPALAAVHRLGLAFDLIWGSGVWLHIPPPDRPRAMRNLATLLKPGGRLVITVPGGPAPGGDRPHWPVSATEVERLGLDMGLALRVATDHQDDGQRRPGPRWRILVLDLPDDGAGALPLLRGVILKQEKNATYKLALLRCIARIADASPNVARQAGGHVALPLGLVALFWLRMFKPLLAAGLPQRPDARLGFVKDAFRALGAVPASGLRPGASFNGPTAESLRRALADAARLIADMPAKHLSFADNAPVFPTLYGRMPPPRPDIAMDQHTLWIYGATHVPLTIWTTLRRMAAWIEPMLIAEWLRLTQSYAENLGMPAGTDLIMDALRWMEPDRDTHFVRDLTLGAFAQGQIVRCVWTGKPLTAAAFDIDHCLPWSAWPCGDLWNLLPAAPAINRHGKRERIVSGATLAAAKPLIQSWWQTTYLDADDRLRARFAEEAQTTLPIPQAAPPDLEDLFQALDFRRLRLRQDIHLAEWHGARLGK
jgi:SAM-dependent methyltransferase